MKLLDWTLPTPAENLAADEALLDRCEAADSPEELLRFWEADRPFVVVGRAEKAQREVHLEACAARGVPVLRRCSGGGTVLQGPGCLNYALVLRIDPHGPTRNIASTNRFVLERNARALESVLPQPAGRIRLEGHTDLTLDGRKFSGNAQRRRRRCLLFHGTILLGLELPLMELLLPQPSREPPYRNGRPHGAFLCRLPLTAAQVKAALRSAWQADEIAPPPPLAEIRSLVEARYARPEWNLDAATLDPAAHIGQSRGNPHLG